MGNVLNLHRDELTTTLLGFIRAKRRPKVWIRFEPHPTETRLERRRWDIQGCLQRHNSIKHAKGFTLELARSGDWFSVKMKPEAARKFAKDMRPHVRRGWIEVWIGDHQLGADPARRVKTS
ncbi:hypothetical protein VQH23_26150 (plasmid) [Pararoseomonas sp. SCSIO 73927]|uniref:hypothetical protein n=1 Tax=Pararoseomonas sp. SCSIO 73927 TaxID=3114537 RepID=UPI0030CDCD9F